MKAPHECSCERMRSSAAKSLRQLHEFAIARVIDLLHGGNALREVRIFALDVTGQFLLGARRACN